MPRGNKIPQLLYNIINQISSKKGKGVIIICDCCGFYICPSSCPNFNGRLVSLGYPIGECYNCLSDVYSEEPHHVHDGRILCEKCASEVVSVELLEYLDCENIKEFFSLLW